MLQTFRFSLFAIVLQLCFIILFMVFVRYPELGVPLTDVEFNVSNSSSEVHGAAAKLEVGQSYSCKSVASLIVVHNDLAVNFC